jgi:putative transposase
LSIVRQCELSGLARSSFYYTPAGDSAEDLELMRRIDEQYTRTPFYGSRRMTFALNHHGKTKVNRKRVQRLMQRMGLEAIYPKPKLSKPAPGHRIYPYLLRNVKIERPNQVWSTDITYVRLREGFVYLVAILDWYSRYVLAWEVSTMLDTSFSSVPDAIDNLRTFFPFYNFDRPHQSLGNQTPAAVYFGIPKTTPQYEKLAMLQVGRAGDRRLEGILVRNFLQDPGKLKRMPLRGGFS